MTTHSTSFLCIVECPEDIHDPPAIGIFTASAVRGISLSRRASSSARTLPSSRVGAMIYLLFGKRPEETSIHLDLPGGISCRALVALPAENPGAVLKYIMDMLGNTGIFQL